MPSRRAWIPSERLRVLLLLPTLWLLFSWPIVLSSGVPFERDLLELYIPVRQYLHDRLLRGELPQWFPFDGLGTPFIGQIVTATFHPETWLLLPFPAAQAVKLNLLLLYLFALAGGYKLARAIGASRVASVAGACTLAFGGYGLGVANNLPYVLGWATLPWVFWSALRVTAHERAKDAALLGVILASIFLGGDAQGFLMGAALVMAALLMRGFSRRRVLLMTGACVIAALTMGAELIPALHLAVDSSRSTVVGRESLGWDWALHPLRLAGFIIPAFTPPLWQGRIGLELFRGAAYLWSSSIFVGGVALWLAVTGALDRRRTSLVLAGLLVLSVWLAIGHRAGLLRLAWLVIPILRGFRFPEKYLALAWVALGPLVALGVDRLHAPGRRWPALAGAGALLCLAGAFFVGSHDVVGELWRRSGHPLTNGDPVRAALQEAWKHGLLTTGLLLLIASALAWNRQRWPSWRWGLAGLVFLELWAGDGGLINLAPPGAFTAPNPFARLVRAAAPRHGPPDHVFHFRVRLLDPNAADDAQELYVRDARLKMLPATDALDGVSGLGFILPGSPRRAFEALGTDPEQFRKLAPFFNGCFAVTALNTPLEAGQTEVARDARSALKLLRQACLPHAYLSAVWSVPDLASAIQNYRRVVAASVAEWEAGPTLSGHGGTVRWLESSPERLRMEVVTPEPTGLIVNDAFARGWRATIDGREVPIYPANEAVRGVAVPAGRHIVEMRYQTPGLPLGLASSALGLLLALGAWWASRRRSQIDANPPKYGMAPAEGASHRV